MPRYYRRIRYLMGSPFEVMVFGERETCENAIEAVFNEIARLERLLSIYRQDSEISRINRGETSTDRDVQEILALSLQYKNMTNGAFDIRSSGTINLGAIGKGYAVDKAVVVLKRFGITRAKISCRSTIYGYGGAGWPVTIEGGESVLLRNKAISTSSNMEQPGHIINPNTGSSVERIGSTSVLSKSAAESDALSTAAFVLGKGDACVALTTRRTFLAKAASFLLFTFFAPLLGMAAVVYQTEDEALKKMLPDADRFDTKEVVLTASQKLQAEQIAGKRFSDATFRVNLGMKKDRIIGYIFPIEVIGKERPITLLIGVTPDGAITSVEVLIYRESQGSEIRYPRFMAQFLGKKKEDPLRMGDDIQSISGATLSSRGVTYGVRKALAIFDIIREKK